MSHQRKFGERQSDRVRSGLFREKCTAQTECGPSEKERAAMTMCF